ncbi:AMP-binding protein [Ramlibacter sp. WS9]|uniref:AMP-binding protein n=1 Tax=Ramlibacter sp. WS9 TaxID=1882741 RepID=UPI001144D1D1|nr:AMP-binding protein [Ramlibacter sp. WS9]ROZ75088.1 AMP-dependent synthetase [Ramlibacter sp. WS9]
MSTNETSKHRNGATRSFAPLQPIPGVVYPPQEALERYSAAGLIGHTTLAEAFMATHAAHSGRPALVGAEGRFTHAQLDSISDRVAAAFLDLGLQPSDRVVFQLPNCNELVFALLGCFKAGLIPVCALTAHREREIGYLARHAWATVHLVPGDDAKFDHVEFSHHIRSEVPSLRHTIVARGPARDGALSLHDLYTAQDPEVARRRVLAVPRDPYQAALFQLSGGTSGVPKIIPRFSSEYVYNMRAMAAWLGFGPDDCFFNPMPLIHNFNLACCSGPTLLAGGAVALAPTLDPDTITAVLRDHRPTWMVLPRPILVKLQPALDAKVFSFDTGRGMMSSNSSEMFEQLTGLPTFHNFGMTEGVIMSTHPDDPEDIRRKTVGRPISEYDEVRILKPGTEEPVADGEIGEAVFRGPYTLHGYFDAPERNAEAFTSDGFYRAGDLMSKRVVDGNTYFVYEGRIKDVVDRAGEKINAEEVEIAVGTHPAVSACAVIGVKDKDYGERLCACIVLQPGNPAPDIAQMGRHLQVYGLAKFKWPERIEVLPAMPQTAVGKPDKGALRDRFGARAGG